MNYEAKLQIINLIIIYTNIHYHGGHLKKTITTLHSVIYRHRRKINLACSIYKVWAYFCRNLSHETGLTRLECACVTFFERLTLRLTNIWPVAAIYMS